MRLPMFSNGCFLTVWQWPESSFGQDYYSILTGSGEEHEAHCKKREENAGIAVTYQKIIGYKIN